MSWFQWRGPGQVKFDPESVPITNAEGVNSRDGGSAITTATFDKPGKYVLMAYAEDMSLFTQYSLTVTVTGGTSGKN